MRFPPEILDDIRNRLPISQVVGRRVTFDRRKSQPARGDFWACCPFHQEKTPSFHCDDRRGIYHCFGCGASGDHFKFVIETEGLAFGEAVERLAGEAGVAMPKPDPRDREREAVRLDLVGVLEAAAAFFEQKLRSPEGKRARDYLTGRSLAPKTVAEFRLGYAPDSRDGLKSHLLAAGIAEEMAVTAGLLIRPEDGRATYDRFRGRVMIPIHDDRGRVVAFGGRALEKDQQPKYLNSPETPVFHKGTMLFNVHRAREAAHKSGTIIVTEGYMDAIAVHQAGIRNVVAALGTAFTEDHVQRLWRFAPEPVICFDGDRAGVAAAHRSIDRILPLLKSGFSFNFCFLPDGQDPDDLVRSGGAQAFLAEVGRAQPLSEVLWDRETADFNIDTPERKAALELKLYGMIAQISDQKVAYSYRAHIRTRLSQLFYESKMKGRRGSQDKPAPGGLAPAFSHDNKRDATEKIILGLTVHRWQLLDELAERVFSINFYGDGFNVFCRELYRLNVEFSDMNIANIYDRIDERFFFVLDEVHGHENPSKNLPRGHKLYLRVPILKYHPHEAFVREFFTVLLEKLDIWTLNDEIEADLSTVGINADQDGAEVERLLSIIEEKQRMISSVAVREKMLEEEAAAIRKAVHPQLQTAA